MQTTKAVAKSRPRPRKKIKIVKIANPMNALEKLKKISCDTRRKQWFEQKATRHVRAWEVTITIIT